METQFNDYNSAVPSKLSICLSAGPCRGTELQAKGLHLTIGRTKASKLHIKDSAVSEKHAVISWEGSAWTLKDMGSSNGTSINGRALQPLIESVVLKQGDRILFGVESIGEVKIELRTVGELTVEQLLSSLCEAAASRIEAQGQSGAKQLLTELSQVKALLNESLETTTVGKA